MIIHNSSKFKRQRQSQRTQLSVSQNREAIHWISRKNNNDITKEGKENGLNSTNIKGAELILSKETKENHLRESNQNSIKYAHVNDHFGKTNLNESGNQIEQKHFKQYPPSSPNQIYTSQFIVGSPISQSQSPALNLSQNIARIIKCKNETESLVFQISSYINLIKELKHELKNERRKQEQRQNENKQLRYLLHRKNLEIIDVKEERDRITRMFMLQSVKNRVIREAVDRDVEQKWEKLWEDRLREVGGYEEEELQRWRMSIQSSELTTGSSIMQNNSRNSISISKRKNKTSRKNSRQKRIQNYQRICPSSVENEKKHIKVREYLDRNPEVSQQPGRIIKSQNFGQYWSYEHHLNNINMMKVSGSEQGNKKSRVTDKNWVGNMWGKSANKTYDESTIV